MKEHPSAEEFSAYLEGKMPRGGVSRQAFEEHLSQCDVCLESLVELAEINRQGNEIPADFMNQVWARMKLPAKEQTPLLPWALRLAALFLVLGVLTYFHFFDGKSRPDGRLPQSLGEKSVPAEGPGAVRSTVPGGAQRQVQPTPARNVSAAVRDGQAAEMKRNELARKKVATGPLGMTPPVGGSQEKSEPAAVVPAPVGDTAVAPEAVTEAHKEALQITASLEKETPPSRRKGEAVPGVADTQASKDKEQTMPVARQAVRQRYYRNEVQAAGSQAASVSPLIRGDVSRSDWQNPQLAAQLPALNRDVTCLVDIDNRGQITALTISGELPVNTRVALEKWIRLMVFTPDSRRLRQAAITFGAAGAGSKVN